MRQLFCSLGIALSLGLFGCGNGGGGTPDAGPHGCEEGAPTVSAQQFFTDVVEPQCVTCHNAAASSTTNGGLVMEDLAALQAVVGKASGYSSGDLKVVDPKNPANSTMYLKVLGGTPEGHKGPKGQSVGGVMPQTGELSDPQKEQVKNWICSEG